MIDYIKSLPKPVLIGSCIVIYILIGMVVSFIDGLFDDGNGDFMVMGIFWVFVLPLAAFFGVLWLFIAPFKLGVRISKPSKVSNIPHEEVSDELAESLDKKYGFDDGVYYKDDPWWEELL